MYKGLQKLRNDKSGRNSLLQGKAYKLVVLSQIVSLQNVYMSGTGHTEQHMFGNSMYVLINIHSIPISHTHINIYMMYVYISYTYMHMHTYMYAHSNN